MCTLCYTEYWKACVRTDTYPTYLKDQLKCTEHYGDLHVAYLKDAEQLIDFLINGTITEKEYDVNSGRFMALADGAKKLQDVCPTLRDCDAFATVCSGGKVEPAKECGPTADTFLSV